MKEIQTPILDYVNDNRDQFDYEFPNSIVIEKLMSDIRGYKLAIWVLLWFSIIEWTIVVVIFNDYISHVLKNAL